MKNSGQDQKVIRCIEWLEMLSHFKILLYQCQQWIIIINKENSFLTKIPKDRKKFDQSLETYTKIILGTKIHNDIIFSNL